MPLQQTPYTVAFLLAGVVLLGLSAYLLVRFRDSADRAVVLTLAAIMGLSSVWSLASGVQIASTAVADKVFWARVSFAGLFIPPLWLEFALLYTDRSHAVDRRLRAVAYAPGVAVAGAVLLFGPEATVWSSVARVDRGFYVLDTSTTSWYFGVVAYLYLVVLAGMAVLYRWLYRSQAVYRGQAVALLVGSLAPTVANVMLFAEVGVHPNVDVTPLGFLVTGVAFSYALVRYRLLDLVPIGRDSVIEEMRDGYLVLDEGTVVDLNPAARELVASGDPVGEPVAAVLPGSPDLPELVGTDEPVTFETPRPDGERVVEVRPSDLGDGRGTLLMLQDVTERERRTEELRRANERLELFATTVSHDLRNPLTVARGYADMAMESPDRETVEEILVSLDRMEAIIDSILALARGGEVGEETEPVDLEALARDAWESVATGDATLAVESTATVVADREQALRLFENLFRNAMEHARQTDGGGGSADADGAPGDGKSGPSVRVGARDDGFYVEDDGPGFPESTTGDLLEVGVTTSESGTGLGLAIVREIAEAHGWQVDLGESEAGGARIEVRDVSDGS